jgi:hypothetical protein
MPSPFLIRHWVHSHEEDSATEMVFRPASFRFPPSRGRAGFELRADGSMSEHGPGPVDTPVSVAGQWREEPDGRLVFLRDGQTKSSRDLKVIRAEADRLVVRNPASPSP